MEVIIPFAGDDPHRARALGYVLARYADRHPDWTVTVAMAPPGPWVKALAVMPAIEASAADVVAVADADVWCDRTADAVEAVARYGVKWAIPHCTVHRLTEAGTAAVYADEPWERQSVEQAPYRGVTGGGIVVARRDTLLDIPLDPRFVGWGSEDLAWGVALHTLLGPPWRSSAPLVHLWHPPQPRMSRKRGSRASHSLYCRYRDARHDKTPMRTLTEEAQHALKAAQQDVPHHAPLSVRDDRRLRQRAA